jgi:hypothetical protein
MPVVANEAAAYGYEAENRHFVRAFLGLEPLRLTFDDGVDVVELLMAAYQSAEQERTLSFPPEGLEAFVPAVARGTWRGYPDLTSGGVCGLRWRDGLLFDRGVHPSRFLAKERGCVLPRSRPSTAHDAHRGCGASFPPRQSWSAP